MAKILIKKKPVNNTEVENEAVTPITQNENVNASDVQAQLETLLSQEQPMCTSSNFTYGLEESIFMDDVESRKLFLSGVVGTDIERQINYFVMKYNEVDKDIPAEERLPIKIYVNSFGGSVMSGLGCIETIRSSITPVWTICMGYALSMGFNIFVAGDRRFATPTSIFLNHDGSMEYGDSLCKFKDFTKFNDRLTERLDKYIVEHTKFTLKELEDTRRIENYMFGDEAKDVGVVTDIIGIDCTLDEIF